MKFDEAHCHKWALLLKQRKKKIDKALECVASEDFGTAKKLVSEVFHGSNSGNSDPGMTGSLLYHMAMISKMASESRVILEELKVEAPSVEILLQRFYGDFVSDAEELLGKIIPVKKNLIMAVNKPTLTAEEKIRLFRRLTEETKKVEEMLDRRDHRAKDSIQRMFLEWTENIVGMRLRQEYETIKGFLILKKLTEELGVERLEQTMACVFGSLDASLKL
jgi:hypothetical protein